jgi:hypothetical protein
VCFIHQASFTKTNRPPLERRAIDGYPAASATWQQAPSHPTRAGVSVIIVQVAIGEKGNEFHRAILTKSKLVHYSTQAFIQQSANQPKLHPFLNKHPGRNSFQDVWRKGRAGFLLLYFSK